MTWSQVQTTESKVIYCVAGGPSLVGFPMARLNGRTVVAVNDAVRHLPLATAFVTCDRQWAHRRMEDIKKFAGDKYFAVGYAVQALGFQNLIRKRDDGLSQDPATIHVASSGYGALNVAFLMGARDIFLLGYDYKQGGKHWYPDKGAYASTLKEFERWARKYDTTLPQLREAGVRVWNANPNSLIEAFPKVSLEEI